MTAYMNGHTIHQHRYHGELWYTVDDLSRRFRSMSAASRWVQERFGRRAPRQLPPVPGTTALRSRAVAA